MAHRYLNRQVHLPTSRAELQTRLDQPGDNGPMTDAERCVVETLLRRVYPDSAIEVGTNRGGNLDVLRRYCRKVYSLDPSPRFRDEHEGDYPNVEFVVGDPNRTLPDLMDRIAGRKERLEFVLMDGKPSGAAVRSELNSVLKHKPWAPVHILVHNSFHPDCRGGILSADWAGNPHAHVVEADYVTGRFSAQGPESRRGTMSCGLALALLLPELRVGPPVIHENDRFMYRALVRKSVHHRPTSTGLLARGREVVVQVAEGGGRHVSRSLKRLDSGVPAHLKQRWRDRPQIDWAQVPGLIRSRIASGRPPQETTSKPLADRHLRELPLPTEGGGSGASIRTAALERPWAAPAASDQRRALLGSEVRAEQPVGGQGIPTKARPGGRRVYAPPRLDLQNHAAKVVGRYRGHLVRSRGWFTRTHR